MSTVISVENITKSYRLGMIGGGTLKEDVSRWWAKARRRPDPLLKFGEEHHARRVGEQFWALDNVSFQVKQGEVLGIIGRNGAGKSTLLKILSQVTAPTAGEIKVKGRIASLLEVGTGFHPELSGRENIFLNGAILGMTKAEIRRKLDEIIAFSGVEEFLDSPVKRYSSGMYVRLAFAVAAHLDPEILVVDEVLAVGDADFQKKCIGKMKDLSIHGGRTVLLVSHALGMVSSLCTRALLLDGGKLAASGTPSEVINKYLGASETPYVIDYRSRQKVFGDSLGRLLYAAVEDEHGVPTGEIDIRKAFSVRMDFEILEDVPRGPHPNFHFFDGRGEYAFAAVGSNLVTKAVSRGIYSSRCHVPGELLNNGPYSIGVALTFIHNGVHVSFYDQQGLTLNIVDPIDETLMVSRGGYAGSMPGPVRPNLRWETQKAS